MTLKSAIYDINKLQQDSLSEINICTLDDPMMLI